MSDAQRFRQTPAGFDVLLPAIDGDWIHVTAYDALARQLAEAQQRIRDLEALRRDEA